MSRRFLAALSLLSMFAAVAPASAQEPAPLPQRINLNLSAALPATAIVPPVVMEAGQLPVRFTEPLRPQSGSSTLMNSLYASTAVMQALDVHSTLSALGNGAREANPFMAPVTGNKAAFIALKAGVAVSTVLAARNMAKRNKVAAVLTLVAVNSAYAMVIKHNYGVAGAGR